MTRISICTRTTQHRGGESGYMLLSVLFLILLLTISLSVAMPRVIHEIQRDKELECMQRGHQYIRAIQLFYRRTGNYPTDLAQLENTNNIRFLRKRYIDPLTNSNFKLVLQGQVMPGMLDQGRQIFGQPWGTIEPGSATGGPIPGLGITVPGGPSGYGGLGGVTAFINPNGTPSTENPSIAQAGDVAAPANGASDLSNAPITNRRIVGVSSVSGRASIRVYKKQTHYSDWQFVYDPTTDGLTGAGYAGANTPVQGANASAISPASTSPPVSPVSPIGLPSTPPAQ
jgi:type II secretory pathway pseudopilin PulG